MHTGRPARCKEISGAFESFFFQLHHTVASIQGMDMSFIDGEVF